MSLTNIYYGTVANAQRRGTLNATSTGTVWRARGSAIEIPTTSKSVVNSSTGFLAPGQEACRRPRTRLGERWHGCYLQVRFCKTRVSGRPQRRRCRSCGPADSTSIENSYGGNAGAMVHTLAVDPFNASVVYTGSFGGLARQPTAVSRGNICPTRGLRRVLVLSPLILMRPG